jgi:ribosomal protein L11 methyltransferase
MVAEILERVAPGGFAIEEPYVPLGPEEGARLEPWRPTVFKLYLPTDADLAAHRRRLEAALAPLRFPIDIRERRVQPEDWAESWKRFFQVEHIGRRLVIRPSWRPYAARPGDVVIDLDPGMAFGTGQHPTTRLCLAAVEDFIPPRAAVLDLGCGSGILSVAAAKLGAETLWALDIERAAVDATSANAERNGVASRIHCALGSLGDAWPFEQQPLEIADLIVANISAAVLVDRAAPIARALRRGGVFIGSGIIADRLDEVLLAGAAAGLTLDALRADGDWRAVIARRQ